MNLSSLVHVRKRAYPLTVDYISEDQFLPQKYQVQRHSQGYLLENEYSSQKEQIMAASLMSNPYAQQTASYAYIQVPQPPPSPPVEEIPKYSLPSISSLLGIADNNGPQQQEQPKQSSQQAPEDRKASLQYTPTSVETTPRQSLPLTPPTHSDSGSESRHSPSSSVSSTQYGGVSNPSTYYFTAGANINMDMNLQRQSIPHRDSRAISIPLSQAQYALPTSYTMAPTPHILNSYYPANPQISNGMYFQRPLSNFTPTATNPWQHHHYIAPSSSSFPLPQDRYICPTCSKAFSRPSSLRIHSHSHTGEKPFRCPVRGCGKKFSVRSNMKRHERGCHGESGC